MSRVTVIGAGNVGTIAGMSLAASGRFDEVVLVDNAGGRAAGIALDITHSGPLLGFSTRVRGERTVAEAGASEYVIITAGRARTPGMGRADLVGVNAAIVGDLAAQVAQVSPGAVIVVVTNPVDEMTQHVQAVTGFPTERVIGMAGLLDSARFRALTALEAKVTNEEVSAIALGSHGDEMVLPLSQATIDGRPILDVLDADTVDGLVDRARNSGGEVVGLLGNGSAFVAPGTSAARMVLDMAGGFGRSAVAGETISATVAPSGQYGIDGGYVGLPVRLGPTGVAEIVELDLSDDELTQLRSAAAAIAERVSAM
ncbi:malate dehydrogenase [Gordonia jinhuaensis]|uniref:Malate dehydrogenase n=1 Tax=Gordonia jinhuaensis TaxID=1517702 RepID=A0A916T8F7_9ACTN|nr:malate dehydrogenase [Gordonia jinhuaensis]GGB35586.1 malate dehydrogenase [Gordonia jinhuaensis]